MSPVPIAKNALLGDFEDSPVVAIAGDAGQWIVGGGLAYGF